MLLTTLVYTDDTEVMHLLQMLNEGKRLLKNDFLEQLNHISAEMWQKLAGLIKGLQSITSDGNSCF